MKFTPEDLEKLQTKQLANIIRKLNAGKTLTAREERLLAEARAADPGQCLDVQTSRAGAGNFARSWDELAKNLGVSRRSLQDWRDAPRFPHLKDWPRPRADGRHDVTAWLNFMVLHGLKRADENEHPDDVPEERRSIRDWKEQREKLLCEKLAREIARGDGLLLVATDLEVLLGATFASIQTKLSQFPARVARFMVNKRDESQAEATLRDEMDAVLTDLHRALYLDDCINDVAAGFPFDDETRSLYERVSFGGQDRDAFVELLQLSLVEALRRIGRRAIAQPESRPETPGPDESADHSLTPSAATPATQKESAPPLKKGARAKSPRRNNRKSSTPRRKRGQGRTT